MEIIRFLLELTDTYKELRTVPDRAILSAVIYTNIVYILKNRLFFLE